MCVRVPISWHSCGTHQSGFAPGAHARAFTACRISLRFSRCGIRVRRSRKLKFIHFYAVFLAAAALPCAASCAVISNETSQPSHHITPPHCISINAREAFVRELKCTAADSAGIETRTHTHTKKNSTERRGGFRLGVYVFMRVRFFPGLQS